MKKISLILLILSIVLIVGCSSQEHPSIGDVTCNTNTVGRDVQDDCNTCTCVYDPELGYGWACTEIGCNAIPFI